MLEVVGKAAFATDLLRAYPLPMSWFEFKDYLSQITDLHQDALHIYAALLVQLTVIVVLRRSFASIIPWLGVLAILLFNEALDLSEPGKPIEEWQVLGGLRDVWNTMVLPTLLWLIARFAPSWMIGDRRDAASERRQTIMERRHEPDSG